MFRNLIQKTKTQFQAIHSGFHLFIAESKQSIIIRKQPLGNRTRKDFLLLQKNMQDRKRLVPFMVCAVIIPELIPLLVIKGMVPSTMLTSDQRISQRDKRIAFRKKSVSNISMQEDTSTMDYIKQLPWKDLRTLNQFFGLSSFTTRQKLLDHLEFLDRDDDFVLGLDNDCALSEEEIQEVVFQRGLPELDMPNFDALKELLRERKKANNVVSWTLKYYSI
jgi:hypothetical protein